MKVGQVIHHFLTAMIGSSASTSAFIMNSTIKSMIIPILLELSCIKIFSSKEIAVKWYKFR
jgi:hypothetical protein